jgi:trimethylamine-N-oxide reductase (cytochrome c)
MKLAMLLWGIPQAMRLAARMYPEYASRLKQKDCVAQIRLRDGPEGRWIGLTAGRISSGRGMQPQADVTIELKDRAIAERLLTPPFDLLDRVDAAKNFEPSGISVGINPDLRSGSRSPS